MRTWCYLSLLLLDFILYPRTGWALDRTPTGFYYPTGTSNIGNYAEFLASGCKENNSYLPDKYHLGKDIKADVGDLVYAISDGQVVIPPSLNGWDAGNIGLVIKHKLSNGSEFLAVYGHIRSVFNQGDHVVAGDPFATIGPLENGSKPHLHFGIHPSLSIQSPLGMMPCTSWPNSNGFIDPINWITTETPMSLSSCQLFTSSSTPIPPGFGAWYDVFSPSDLLLRVNCGSSSTAFRVGKGSPFQFIYDEGWKYVAAQKSWQKIIFSGPVRATNRNGKTYPWFTGSAHVDIDPSIINTGDNYVVAYICTWTGSEWKCGCRDNSCNPNANPKSGGLWQVQGFQR